QRVLAGEVDTPVVGDDRRVAAVRVVPDDPPGAGVEGERLARAALDAPEMGLREPAERREVDEPRHHSGRAHDAAGSGEPPADVARPRVESGEVAVPGPDEDLLLPDRGGGVDVRSGLV